MLDILEVARSNIRKLSEQADVSEGDFQKNIGELKAILFKLRNSFANEAKLQVEEIISYQVISQRPLLQRLLIRHFGTLPNHKWPIAKWDQKGKFVYDLNVPELKLSGLIHKVKNSEQQIKD